MTTKQLRTSLDHFGMSDVAYKVIPVWDAANKVIVIRFTSTVDEIISVETHLIIIIHHGTMLMKQSSRTTSYS